MTLVNNRYLTWLSLAALAITLAGCAGTAVKRETTKVAADEQGLRVAITEPESEFEPIDYRAYQYYVNGLLFEELKDMSSASMSFEQAWRFCPESTEIGLAYARTLFKLRDYSKSLEVTNKLDSGLADVLLLKADCYRKKGDASRAKQTFLDLHAVDSTREIGYMFLTGYYQKHGKPDSAIWALTNLARVLPAVPEVQTELGRAYQAVGNLVAARAAFRQAIVLDPSEGSAKIWLRLSETFEPEGQSDSSLAVLEAALEQHPFNTVLHSGIARLWIMRDSIMPAIPHLRTVAELSPENHTARRRLGIMLMAVDSLIASDSVLSSLVADGDADPNTRFYLGRLAILNEDFSRARDELTLVTKHASNFPDGWMALGFCYRQLDQPEEEIATYQAGLLQMREEQDAIQIYFALGAAFEQSDQVDSAISAFEEILDHDPDHAASLNYLGYLLADKGIQLEYARELLERAVSLQPNNAAFLDSYGWVFYRLGDYDAAVQYLSSAVELDSDPVIYDHFGDALHARGETDRAREWWQRALDQQPENESIREKLSY
jgi:tetratricopeptide (TPR) repeat protein